MTDKPNTYVGIDTSGAQTRCVVGVGSGSDLRHVSHGSMPTLRWEAGDASGVRSLDQTTYEAVSEAELDGGLTVGGAVVGVGDASVRSYLIHSRIGLPGEGHLVDHSHIGEAIRKCGFALPVKSMAALQLVSQEFGVDGRRGFRQPPVGLPARRIEAFVEVIAVDRQQQDLITKAVHRAGVRVEDTVLGGFAAAYGTLLESECLNGVAHLDFGRAASTLTAYTGGILHVASGVPVGWNHLVGDVARAFSTDRQIASSLISNFGGVDQADQQSTAYILVPGGGTNTSLSGRSWPRAMLDKVISLRVEECIQLARDQLRHEGLMRGGVQSLVLTGDIAALPGIKDLAQAAAGLRTRVGVPNQPAGMPEALRNPRWAAAAGLVLYAHRLAGNPKPREAADVQQRQEVLR